MESEESQINRLANQLYNDKYNIKVDIDNIGVEKCEVVEFFENEGEPIGVCLIMIVRTITRRVMYVEEVVVRKDKRKIGVGQCMVEYIKEKARNAKCDCVELNVSKSCLSSKNLYEKNGFKIRKQIPMNLILKTWKKSQ